MTVQVPLTNQFVVFWIDPKLTLDTWGEGDNSELVEYASTLPFQKYVGRVSMGIPMGLSDATQAYKIQFVTMEKSPACPAVRIDEDMAFALEPSTQTDLPPDEPIPTSRPLPWTDACHPAFFACQVLCRPFQSEVIPITMETGDARLMSWRADSFRKRRGEFSPPLKDRDDSDAEDDPYANGPKDSMSSLARRNARELLLPLETAANADPLGRLWWSMKVPHSAHGERPTVQVSADLSLVPELPADPLDFSREYQTLLMCILESKAQKIARVKEQNEIQFGGTDVMRPFPFTGRSASSNLRSQRTWLPVSDKRQASTVPSESSILRSRLAEPSVSAERQASTVPSHTTNPKGASRLQRLARRIRSHLATFRRHSA